LHDDHHGIGKGHWGGGKRVKGPTGCYQKTRARPKHNSIFHAALLITLEVIVSSIRSNSKRK
jgi:hypothetical protein